MKKKRFFRGMLITLIGFFIIPFAASAEEYYKLTEIKGDNELIGITHTEFCATEEEPNKVCEKFYPISISTEWIGSEPTEHGALYLNQYYEWATTPYKTFSVKIIGNELDESKNYILEYTAYDGSIKKIKYTGKELLNGVVLELDPKGTYSLNLKEEGKTELINVFGSDPCEYSSIEMGCDLPLITYDLVNIKFSNYYQELVDIYNLISEDGVIKLNSVKPDDENFEMTVTSSLMPLIPDGYSAYASFAFDIEKMQADTTKTQITISSNEDGEIFQTFSVKYKFVEPNEEIAKKVDEVAKKFDSDWNTLMKGTDGWFLLDDLENINYLYNATKSRYFSDSKLPNYSSKIRSLTNDEKISYDLVVGAGTSIPFYTGSIGAMSLSYDGVIYKTVEPVGFLSYNIIYVPSDTEKTRDAFIAAAKSRIENYLKDSSIEITYGGLISELDEEAYKYADYDLENDQITYLDMFDIDDTTGEWYTIKIDDNEFYFIIARNSELMKSPILLTHDNDSNILVKTESYDAPLDSKISAIKLDSNSDEYKEIAKKANIINNLAFNLNLYSSSLEMYIAKIAGGNFKVYIPVDNETANKNLVSVYIKEDGTIENHPVTIEKDGDKVFAVFETNHFSNYAIVESNNPKTGDNYSSLVIMLIIGTVGFISARLILKKRNN